MTYATAGPAPALPAALACRSSARSSATCTRSRRIAIPTSAMTRCALPPTGSPATSTAPWEVARAPRCFGREPATLRKEGQARTEAREGAPLPNNHQTAPARADTQCRDLTPQRTEPDAKLERVYQATLRLLG